MIEGPAGTLETLLTPPLEPQQSGILTIICHPHPLYGGTMQNKVVTTLAKTFHEMGQWTLRFNFRGIGKSEGEYGNAIGEIDDLLAVVAWAKAHYPKHDIWLAGFSFGSHIAAQVAAQDHTIARLISIAPPVNHFNFEHLEGITCPWLVVMGEEDEIVPVDDVRRWLDQMPRSIQAVFMPDVTHFFHGKLSELSALVKTYTQ